MEYSHNQGQESLVMGIFLYPWVKVQSFWWILFVTGSRTLGCKEYSPKSLEYRNDSYCLWILATSWEYFTLRVQVTQAFENILHDQGYEYSGYSQKSRLSDPVIAIFPWLEYKDWCMVFLLFHTLWVKCVVGGHFLVHTSLSYTCVSRVYS